MRHLADGSEETLGSEIGIHDLFSVKGKVVVVTGGNRGIGSLIASGFVEAGAQVYIVGRNPELGARVTSILSRRGSCSFIGADLSSDDGVQAVFDRVSSEYSEVHVLVNNAGTAWGAPLQEYPVSAFNKVLAVNLVAPFQLITTLLPLLRKAANESDPARIINVGSTDGTLPPRYESYAYSSSKAGLHMLTRHLAHRLARESINVNVLSPGLFPTKMTALRFRDDDAEREASEEIPVGRPGERSDICGAAIFLASRASAYITGAILPVDGGYASLR
jgi:NAD(P)-dependent dehydrogenase (short-subunit alcohol dehydrogenase family)